MYRRLFSEASLEDMAPYEPEWAKPVYHLYVVRMKDREGLIRQFGEAGIGTGIHYPVPLHLQKADEQLGHGVGECPVAEKVAAEFVSLPMWPGVRRED